MCKIWGFKKKYIFFNTTLSIQKLLTVADITLIIMAVLQLCVSITVTVLSLTALLKTPTEVWLTAVLRYTTHKSGADGFSFSACRINNRIYELTLQWFHEHLFCFSKLKKMLGSWSHCWSKTLNLMPRNQSSSTQHKFHSDLSIRLFLT